MNLPMLRLDNADPMLMDELMEAVAAVAATGAFTGGAEVAAFEAEWAAYCEVGHAMGVSSGTEALALALRAIDVGPGDEVIVPTNTFIATAEAVSLVGATPKLVDVDPDSHLLTAELVRAALSERTRCVIPVHLYGSTVDMDPILDVAAEAGIRVIEDTAQAHGAIYKSRRVGTLGDLGCFSFYPTKNLGAWGDAGAVVTNDPELADRVRLFRSHGERPRYHHLVPGTTARLDSIQAAVLRRKIPRLDAVNARRRELGALLREGIEGTAVELIAPPFEGADHVYHLFVVRTTERDAFRAHLDQRGISSAIHYPIAIHRTDAYASLGLERGSLPVSEAYAAQVCSIPIWPGMTDVEAERVIAAVRTFKSSPRPARKSRRFVRTVQAEVAATRS
jgi:dTDP-4-amino-4,6-dideoxygalactose transaminase